MSLAVGVQALYDGIQIGCALRLGWEARFVLWDRAEVVGRLDFLRRTDTGFTRFGSARHRYLLNQPLTQSAVTAFEARHALSLPEDYRSLPPGGRRRGRPPVYGVLPPRPLPSLRC